MAKPVKFAHELVHRRNWHSDRVQKPAAFDGVRDVGVVGVGVAEPRVEQVQFRGLPAPASRWRAKPIVPDGAGRAVDRHRAVFQRLGEGRWGSREGVVIVQRGLRPALRPHSRALLRQAARSSGFCST